MPSCAWVMLLTISTCVVDAYAFGAATWLADLGADYGLCQIHRNEPRHFELRPNVIIYDCLPMYDDPTQNPRMQQ